MCVCACGDTPNPPKQYSFLTRAPPVCHVGINKCTFTESLKANTGLVFNVSRFIIQPDLGFRESRSDPVCPGRLPNPHLFPWALECALASVKCTGASFSQIHAEHVELTGLGEGAGRDEWEAKGKHRNMVLDNLSAGDWGASSKEL